MKYKTCFVIIKNNIEEKQDGFLPCLLKASRSVFIYQGAINTPFAQNLHTNVKATVTCTVIFYLYLSKVNKSVTFKLDHLKSFHIYILILKFFNKVFCYNILNNIINIILFLKSLCINIILYLINIF